MDARLVRDIQQGIAAQPALSWHSGKAQKALSRTLADGIPLRWPHMHFEVYSSVGQAITNGPIVKTSQIALPQATRGKVYADSRYTGSASSLSRTSLTSDMVFADDQAIHQLATVTGSHRKGFVANLTIAV